MIDAKSSGSRKWPLRWIVRLTLLVVVAFGIPDGHAATPDPVAELITHQSFKAGGAAAAFTATAATLPLADDKGEKQADIYYVAYTRDDAAGASRPITFVFNGGPGSSSAYLHLGALGPRVIDFGPDGQVPSAPGDAGRQSRQLARPQRPGVRRSGRHGL